MAGKSGSYGGRVAGKAADLATARTVKTPAGQAPVIPVIILGAGAYLLWFGIHFFKQPKPGTTDGMFWPTEPVKSVLQGKGLPVSARPVSAKATLAADLAGAGSGGASAGAAGPGAGQTTGPGAGGTYTHSQLMTLWTTNGGDPRRADVAAAVAEAESSGRAGVTSANPDGGTNVGLWQLDTRGKGAGHTVAQLQDPGTNARLAVFGSANGTNWSAWATYASGAYRQFLTAASRPA